MASTDGGVVSELRGRLLAIEHALDAGQYAPGPWTTFIRTVRACSRPVRQALAADVSRVSVKLHRRHPLHTCSLGMAVGLEIAAMVAGGALLWCGLAAGSNTAGIAALIIWVTTFEPVLKIAAGLTLGVRYDCAYLRGLEPRFKTRFGTYLAASRPARILFHLSGCIGSPLAAWIVSHAAQRALPATATVATVLFWSILLINAGLFLVGIAGLRRVGKLRVSTSSGGTAGAELCEALSSRVP